MGHDVTMVYNQTVYPAAKLALGIGRIRVEFLQPGPHRRVQELTGLANCFIVLFWNLLLSRFHLIAITISGQEVPTLPAGHFSLLLLVSGRV